MAETSPGDLPGIVAPAEERWIAGARTPGARRRRKAKLSPRTTSAIDGSRETIAGILGQFQRLGNLRGAAEELRGCRRVVQRSQTWDPQYTRLMRNLGIAAFGRKTTRKPPAHYG